MREDDRLYSNIKDSVIHSTSIDGYLGIRSSGAIKPNNGAFPDSHGQSLHSCCRKLNAVSLLDLRTPSLPLVGRDACWNWKTFLSNHKPITILLDIDPMFLTTPLYGYDSLPDEIRSMTIVPEAEKCYVGEIAFAAIRRCILVSANCCSLFEVFENREITATDIEETSKKFEKAVNAILPNRGSHSTILN